MDSTLEGSERVDLYYHMGSGLRSYSEEGQVVERTVLVLRYYCRNLPEEDMVGLCILPPALASAAVVKYIVQDAYTWGLDHMHREQVLRELEDISTLRFAQALHHRRFVYLLFFEIISSITHG